MLGGCFFEFDFEGLLSLDMNGLKIVMGSGDPKQAKLAKAIAPVRANGKRGASPG